MRRLTPLLLLAAALSGCASFQVPPAPDVAPVALIDTPFFPQTAYHCGPASLAMLLVDSGVNTTPDALASQVYVPERQGAFQIELIAAARQQGRMPYVLQGGFPALLDELQDGRPVLVLQNLAFNWWPKWHYAVVIGYDPDSDEVLLHSGTREQHRSKRKTFLLTWRRSKQWALVVTRPDTIPATATPAQVLQTAHAAETVGRPQQADATLAAAIQRWPNGFELYLARGNLAYARGDTAKAHAVWSAGAARPEAPGMLFNNLAHLAMEQRDLDDAERLAQMAVARGGKFIATFESTLADIRCRRDKNCR